MPFLIIPWTCLLLIRVYRLVDSEGPLLPWGRAKFAGILMPVILLVLLLLLLNNFGLLFDLYDVVIIIIAETSIVSVFDSYNLVVMLIEDVSSLVILTAEVSSLLSNNA